MLPPGASMVQGTTAWHVFSLHGPDARQLNIHKLQPQKSCGTVTDCPFQTPGVDRLNALLAVPSIQAHMMPDAQKLMTPADAAHLKSTLETLWSALLNCWLPGGKKPCSWFI